MRKRRILATETKAIIRGILASTVHSGLSKQWLNAYGRYAAHCVVLGFQPRPEGTTKGECSAGIWCSHQMREWKAGRLNDVQQELLDRYKIFDTFLHTEWRRKFEEARVYVEEHGRPPSIKVGTKREKTLAQWRFTQRQHLSKGNLKAWQIELLHSIKYDEQLFQSEWEGQFQAFQVFRDKYGRFPSQKAKSPRERLLAHWRTHQEVMRNRGRMTPENRTIFENARLHLHSSEFPWRTRLDELRAFIKQRNRLPYSEQSDPVERVLVVWVRMQRFHYNAGTLATWKTALLKPSGALDSPSDLFWRKQLAEVARVIESKGFIDLLPRDKPVDRNLGIWCSRQRKLAEDGGLDTEHLTALKKAGVLLTPAKKTWLKQFLFLKRSLKVKKCVLHPGSPIPFKTKLTPWINRQIKAHDSGRLDRQQTQALRNLGIVP